MAVAGANLYDQRLLRPETAPARALWTQEFTAPRAKAAHPTGTGCVFVETPNFTRQVMALLRDEEYRGLQNTLRQDPERGDLIQGGGGIRKLRYAVQGRGTSGGVRAIYCWVKGRHQVFMLVEYPKSRKNNLIDLETAVLRGLVKEL